MNSFHFSRPIPLSRREQRLMDRLARQAAHHAECRQTERLLSCFTRLGDTIVTQCSRDLRYLYANERYADFLGRPLERIIGHSIPEVLGEAAFEVIRPHVDRVLVGEREEYEADIPYVHAGLRRVHVVYTPGFDCVFRTIVTADSGRT